LLKSFPARIALLALGFRVLSAVAAFAANVGFPDARNLGYTMFPTASPFWDAFTRHDSGWYCQIARNGYYYTPNGRASIAFFPVYPLLMRSVGRTFGHASADFYLGGIIVSWLAFVVAMVALWKLASLDLPRHRAERAVLLTMIFPFAFFFGMVYTESTFLMFTVLSFYWFRTRRWIPGGFAGALATASRVNGILMLPALAWIAWQNTEPTTRDRMRAAIGLAVVPLGVVSYSLFVYQLTAIPGGSHNPFEWAAAIQRWAYYPGGAPWTAPFALIARLVTHPYAYLAGDTMALFDTLNGVAGILFVAAVPFVWRRLGAAYGLFMLANLWLPLSSGAFEGMGRYCSVMFPAFIWLATIRSRLLSTTLPMVFALFYTLCLALFVNVYPLI
jgi:hypothetical protein